MFYILLPQYHSTGAVFELLCVVVGSACILAAVFHGRWRGHSCNAMDFHDYFLAIAGPLNLSDAAGDNLSEILGRFWLEPALFGVFSTVALHV